MKIFKNEVKSSDDDEKKSVKSEDSTNDTSSNPKP